jgi:C4-dicarboxylate transporter DctQ subunit
MRFITGMSFTPMKELSEYALSILVFLTIPYCAFRGAHVVVDLVTMHLSRHTQARVEAVICLLSVMLCGLITWQLFVRGVAAMNSGEESTMLRIWLAPFVFIAGIGFLMLALIYLMQWLRVFKETGK